MRPLQPNADYDRLTLAGHSNPRFHEGHNPMESNAKMKKKHVKKSMKSGDSMKADTSKEGMKKDTK